MSITVDVTLSNDVIVQVNRLGLFELQDNVGVPDLKPYTVTILYANGTVFDEIYDMSVERKKPDVPFEECKEGSAKYYEWLEYHRYQDGLAYLEQQKQDLIEHLQAVDDYIKANCIGEDDLAKVTSFDDWDMVKAAAISELTFAEIVHYANVIHQATYNDKPLFEAFESLEKSGGSYNITADLEYALMRDLAMIEDDYIQVPKKDRANMIIPPLREKMMEALNVRDQIKKAQENNENQA